MEIDYFGLPFVTVPNERMGYMIIGEVIEGLIQLKKDKNINYPEDNFINDACNILSKLPREMNIYEWIRENTK
jgi:hypothetical protein